MQITYGYYAVEYGGKIIPEQGFQKAERQAEAYIRHLTYVKGDIFAVENDIVKDAVCAAAEVYYKYNAQQQSGTPLVKSENNDGYSVTYVTEQTDGKTADSCSANILNPQMPVLLKSLPLFFEQNRVPIQADRKSVV